MTIVSDEEEQRLRQSRARLIAAGNNERRRIERTLHDGVQQHLVALAVKLRLARDLIPDQPEEAQAILDTLNGEIRDALAELRNLAHRVYPALLFDGGLSDALGVAATRAGVTTTVTTSNLRRYHPDIEAGVYFSVAEALSHLPGDTRAHVHVVEDGGEVRFDVTADGAGFGDEYAASERFALLGDRVEAIGGRVEAGPASDGRGSRLGGAVPAVAPPVTAA